MPTILQGAWALNCDSPPTSWRIFSEDKAIGPLSQVSTVVRTEEDEDQYDIYEVVFDDEYSDEFRVIDNNSLQYLHQYGPDGSIYRDWRQYDVVLKKCDIKKRQYKSTPAFLQGDWSTNCNTPKNRHRLFTEYRAIGPGNNLVNISQVDQIGPLLTVYFDDEGGESFLILNNDSIKYLFQFSPYQITHNWSSVSAVLNRCNGSQIAVRPPDATSSIPTPNPQSPTAPNHPGPGHSSGTILLEIAKNEAVQKVGFCSTKHGLKKLVDSPLGKTLVDVSVDYLITKQIISAAEFINKVAMSYATADLKKKLKDNGYSEGVFMLEMAKFSKCVYDQKTI